MTMGRLHRDRRGNAAYIGRETLPSFFCIPFYRTRRATTAGSSGEADLLLLLLLVLGGSNLFSTRSTNPLLLLPENSSLSTISQRLTTSPSQGWAYRGYGRPNNTRHFLLFHGGCVRATSPPPPAGTRTGFPLSRRDSSFEKRFTIQISFNDLPYKQRGQRTWARSKLFRIIYALSIYVYDLFSWTKIGEGSRKERDIEIIF